MAFTAGQRLTAAALNAFLATVPQQIQSTKLAVPASGISFSSIPSWANHLEIRFALQSAGTANARDLALLQVNGDTNSAHYFGEQLEGVAASPLSSNSANAGIQIANCPESAAAGFNSNQFVAGVVSIPGWTATTYLSVSSSAYGGTTSVGLDGVYGGSFLVTGTRTSLTLKLASTNLNTGSWAVLYGYP